jgi:hypothetical protein
MKYIYERHELLCKIEKDKTGEIQIKENEYKIIVQELLIKINKMEKKMNEMEKYVNKKKKINHIQWLSVNIFPEITLYDWSKNLLVESSDFDYLNDNTLLDTYVRIIKNNIKKNIIYDIVLPFQCFNDKENIFYKFNDVEDEEIDINMEIADGENNIEKEKPKPVTHHLLYLDCDVKPIVVDVDLWCIAPECHLLTVKKDGVERYYEMSELCGGLK